MAQHDDLDRQIGVRTTREADQQEHAAERPAQEPEGHAECLPRQACGVLEPLASFDIGVDIALEGKLVKRTLVTRLS